MKMYFKYLRHQMKSSLQYRAATFMNMFVSSLAVVSMLFSFILIFSKFDTVAGYTLSDVLVTFSVSTMVYALAEFLFRGFDHFDDLILKGNLDVLLLRPRSIVLQVLGQKIEFGKLGRVILSLVILIVVVLTGSVNWTFLKLLTLVLMIASGVVIFFGVFLLSSAFTVFTVSANEVVNIFTHGGQELTTYPLDIYAKPFKIFFTFIVPFATFNYLPLQFILSNATANSWLYMISPIIGMLFVIPCYFVFKWALTKYSSTGT